MAERRARAHGFRGRAIIYDPALSFPDRPMRPSVIAIACALALTGCLEPDCGDEDGIAPEDLPGAVIASIEAEFPGATIEEAEAEDDGYEVEITDADGGAWELELTADGTILEMEQNDDEDIDDDDDGCWERNDEDDDDDDEDEDDD